jgi:hypothetical protein
LNPHDKGGSSRLCCRLRLHLSAKGQISVPWTGPSACMANGETPPRRSKAAFIGAIHWLRLCARSSRVEGASALPSRGPSSECDHETSFTLLYWGTRGRDRCSQAEASSVEMTNPKPSKSLVILWKAANPSTIPIVKPSKSGKAQGRGPRSQCSSSPSSRRLSRARSYWRTSSSARPANERPISSLDEPRKVPDDSPRMLLLFLGLGRGQWHLEFVDETPGPGG